MSFRRILSERCLQKGNGERIKPASRLLTGSWEECGDIAGSGEEPGSGGSASSLRFRHTPKAAQVDLKPFEPFRPENG
jgi:hypothetical protein